MAVSVVGVEYTVSDPFFKLAKFVIHVLAANIDARRMRAFIIDSSVAAPAAQRPLRDTELFRRLFLAYILSRLSFLLCHMC